MTSVFPITMPRYFQLCIIFAKIYCLRHFLLNSQKKCNRLVLSTRDFLFSLAFCELATANFNPCGFKGGPSDLVMKILQKY